MANANEILNNAKSKMQDSEKVLKRDLGKVRAGQANASLLNGVTVDYYGASTPLNQLASITIPEPRVLMVSPYDKSSLDNIEHGILKADIGINPVNDGKVIRLIIPQLTQDRRDELSKKVKAMGEDTKVAIRNVRREAMDTVKKGDKDSEFTDDEMHSLEKQVQNITDQSTDGVDKIVKDKKQEIETD